jgi:hypothetical protein
MAYGNYIATVPIDQIAGLRRDSNTLLRPTRLAMVSHLMAYSIRVQPIGQVLAEALDGGERLADNLEHPLRPPVVHLPADVARLLSALREGLHAASMAGPTKEIGWFRVDIDKLVELFQHAADQGEAVVSVLEPPMDEARAAKVRIPFAVGSE